MNEQDLPDNLKNRGTDLFENSEQQGAAWAGLSDTVLVGLVGFSNVGVNTASVLAEMQRRQVVATREFNKQSTQQAERMIRLTRWIIFLTIALGVIAVVQVATALWPGR